MSVCASCGRQKHVNASTVCQDYTWHTPGIPESVEPVIENTARFIDTPDEVSEVPEKSFAGAIQSSMDVTQKQRGIPGMGTDAPMQTLEGGGKQAQSLYRFDLVDARAMFEMSKVLSTGAEKYGKDNWRLIPVEHHINHAIAHLYAFLAGDGTDDHLTNALCRAMFARAVTLED